jgi:DNA replication protein DnaC
MLIEQTFQQLSSMHLHGFFRALQEQFEQADKYHQISFEERIGLLVDREYSERESTRLTRRLQQAKLREKACLEDIDYRHPRGLDKGLIHRLSSCQWIAKHQNLIITGLTGVGKTYLCCAFADKACREGYSAMYKRLPRFLHELFLSRADGSYIKMLARISKVDLLVIDDWGIAPLEDQQRRDLLEVFEDRHGSRSTIVASQIPQNKWHKYIGDPTVADAILDRIVHNAHKLELSGESIRKNRTKLDKDKEESRT